MNYRTGRQRLVGEDYRGAGGRHGPDWMRGTDRTHGLAVRDDGHRVCCRLDLCGDLWLDDAGNRQARLLQF